MPIPGFTRVKELFGQFIAKGKNAAGTPIAFLAENDGTTRIQLVAWDGAQERVLNETSGRLAIVAYGKDSGANEDPLRTNANQQLQVEVVDGTSKQQRVVDPFLIPAVEADVWAPGLANTIYVDFEFELVNMDGTNDATGVDIGIDLGDDGGGTPDFYLLKSAELSAKGVGLRKGPYRMGGDDAITGVAAAANDVVMHVYIIKEETAV
jgi:hypothetical protein